MPTTAEKLSIKAIDKALKQYLKNAERSLEELHSFKNSSFEHLDASLSFVVRHADGYLEDRSAKIKRLKQLIGKYKEAVITLYSSLKNDIELKSGKLSKSFQQYSQCLYYLNIVLSNINVARFSDPITQLDDQCIAGSVQTVFDRECYVFGTEGNVDKSFTGHQGNNRFGMRNDCGIACVTQILILSGKNVSENDVIRVAIRYGLCSITEINMESNGGTSSYHRAALLEKFDVKARIELATPERIASYVERGHGIIVSVDAGLFWNNEPDIGVGHAIVLYGTIHQASDGALLGFVVCDTGSGNMKRFLSCSDFKRMYYYNRGINITVEAIRK